MFTLDTATAKALNIKTTTANIIQDNPKFSEEFAPTDYIKDKSPNNQYEIVLEDSSNNENDECYFDMNEIQMKRYEEFLENSRSKNDDNNTIISQSTLMNNNFNTITSGNYGSGGGINSTNPKIHSTLMEWSKLLQKNFSNYEKPSININDNKNKLSKTYKIILTLKERNWYEEMTSLYKVILSLSLYDDYIIGTLCIYKNY